MSENDELPIDLEQIDRDLRGRAIDKQRVALAKVPPDLAIPLLAQLLTSSDFIQQRLAAVPS